ncbi:hypothetical protein [Pseudarthrobacter sp. DSP2-3-2b1]|uniref:hypothetical protein n=1 Tax=Pseudarthrobacter sp. DSP2-3-2b1 TaxID=2804661 RepID=UPI003CF7D279
MLVFPAIGLLLWIGFLFAVLVLSGIVWVFCQLVLGILNVISPPKKKTVASVRRVSPRVQPRGPDRAPLRAAPRAAPPVRNVAPRPPQAAPKALSPSDIWPKWTPAHRRYVDEELALWQEQFDALSSRR